ncbi:MAG: hypothetical protein ABSF59_21830 [Candidatus Sulfotelmatobacter sp.]
MSSTSELSKTLALPRKKATFRQQMNSGRAEFAGLNRCVSKQELDLLKPVRRKSWGARFLISARFAPAFTTRQIALGGIPSPPILSSRLTLRKIAPSVMAAAAVHSSTRGFAHERLRDNLVGVCARRNFRRVRHPTRILGKHFTELPFATIFGERERLFFCDPLQLPSLAPAKIARRNNSRETKNKEKDLHFTSLQSFYEIEIGQNAVIAI